MKSTGQREGGLKAKGGNATVFLFEKNGKGLTLEKKTRYESCELGGFRLMRGKIAGAEYEIPRQESDMRCSSSETAKTETSRR